MAITAKDQQELDQIYADYSNKYKGHKNDYFALLYLRKKFKCNIEEIANAGQVAFGGNDYGIDAYFIDVEGRNLYLFQFKWTEDHNQFKESFDRLTQNGIERIFGASNQDPEQNEMIKHLKADLREYKNKIDKVYIHFFFKGDVDAAESSEGLSERQERLGTKKFKIEEYFDNKSIQFTVEFISDKRSSSPPKISDTHKIIFTDRITAKIPTENKIMYVGFVRLIDLYKIYQNIGDKFLSRNIRNLLPSKNPPNRKIREALYKTVIKGETPPELFTFNHNGITIAAEQIEFDDNETIIKVPRLLNGAQTVSSFTLFMEENEKNPVLKSNQSIIESISILAKIVIDDPSSDFIVNVTICNNQQNDVEPWHLHANDKIQCDLQDKFFEELHIHYSRQEGDFKKLSDDELKERGITDTRNIKIKLLAQTLLAIQGEIDKISRLRDVFENPKIYNDTFIKPKYLNWDSRKLILAYKILLCLNIPMKRLQELSSIKLLPVIGKSRNLIFSLLIQAIFNDAKLNNLLDSYGCGLTKEYGFQDELKRLASSRILPILKDVVANYTDKIEKENYNFLRTKEIYRSCMNIAYDKYNWAQVKSA